MEAKNEHKVHQDKTSNMEVTINTEGGRGVRQKKPYRDYCISCISFMIKPCRKKIAFGVTC